MYILNHKQEYDVQESILFNDLKQKYGDRLIVVEAFSKDVAGMVEDITRKINDNQQIKSGGKEF